MSIGISKDLCLESRSEAESVRKKSLRKVLEVIWFSEVHVAAEVNQTSATLKSTNESRPFFITRD